MIETLIAVIGTLIALLLAWLLKMVSDLKKDIKEQIKCIDEAIDAKAGKDDNEKAHKVLHGKIENHYHNEQGHFVLRPHSITDKG